MPRFRTAVVAAIATGAAVLLAPAAAAQPAPGLAWQPCQDSRDVECASLTVPVNWSTVDSGTLQVAVARRKATSANRIGTLVYFPGGPGDSGVGRLLRESPLSPEITSRFDIVSFDPRGTSRSGALVCDPALTGSLPNVDPDTGARFADVLAYSEKLWASCRDKHGALIDNVDSVSVARDVDALRAALGEHKISLYGRSYGTLAQQMYAERFPDRVRAMVLDSVFDHNLGTRAMLESSTRAGEDAFDQFAAWCRRTPSCVLHGQDVGAVFDRLYERAGRGELHEPGEPARLVTPFDLVASTRQPFSGPRWAEFAVRLKSLTDGQGTPVPARPGKAELVTLFCNDNAISFRSEEQWRHQWRRLNRIAPHLRTHPVWQFASLCAGWTGAIPNPQHRPVITGAPPVLLLNSRHDPATGHEWARGVHRDIKRSVLVTYDGSGHGVYERGACTTGVTDRYLLDGVLPPAGTHCPAADPR
ncbi:alpha/beta hydrolase family protein [Herbihabitans rhizosphaerae]|uniref:Alpha/beta hydrolase family protein n=1 Tax=Herbihabitans rhizosphaerae TaxID=1872711 RepID=A0A4Q7KPM3_9PSEU|nr:alpha/beta hydrolase [Herbihabitans rhizosphaerae]RZS37641.1 alpha/beta hydrolase family protein [Herbihabitans rhizosphaerae]